jgi:hypothetical protein
MKSANASLAKGCRPPCYVGGPQRRHSALRLLDTDWRVIISREREGETDARLRGASACRLAPLTANHRPILRVGGEIRARLARGRLVSALSPLPRTELCAPIVDRVLDAQNSPLFCSGDREVETRAGIDTDRSSAGSVSIGGVGRCCRRGGKPSAPPSVGA